MLQGSGRTLATRSGIEKPARNDYDLSRWDINTDDNFDSLSVYSKTFPAGTISIPGNNGGNGSFLIFLERPLSTNDESQYMGCFVNDGARDLDYGPTASAGTWYTFATCQTACVGYSSMSLQYGGECFCQNTYNTASRYAQTSDSVCSMVWTTQLQSGAAHTHDREYAFSSLAYFAGRTFVKYSMARA